MPLMHARWHDHTDNDLRWQKAVSQKRVLWIKGYLNLAILFLAGLLYGTFIIHAEDLTQGAAGKGQTARRSVTVADSIRETLSAQWPSARFSPDGKEFIVALKKGNLLRNTVDYSLLLWKTADAFHPSVHEALQTMSSSSNRPGIEDITWLSDNETIVFLGERPGELHQLFSFNITTRKLSKLTDHPTNILAYSVTPNGDRIAYLAEPPSQSIWADKANHDGFIVTTELLPTLLEGKIGAGFPANLQLFVGSPGKSAHLLRTQDKVHVYLGDRPALSPDGKHIIIATQVSRIPESWKDYAVPDIQRKASMKLSPGQISFLRRFEVVDTISGASRFLLDSPVGIYGSDVAWSPDSRSVVITRVFLPLGAIQGAERDLRASKSFTVEVNIFSGEIAQISQKDLNGAHWDAKSNLLVSHLLQFESNTFFGAGETLIYRKNGTNWEQIQDLSYEKPRPEIIVEEDMHTPPKIFAIDPKSHQKTLLLDLNPQFRELTFAKVEEIEWKGTDGHDVKGGLYYPADYVSGRRYPLVIQTHGWSANRFMIDGPTTSGYAAQPLASHGIFVLQADDSNLTIAATSGEALRETATYEGAIDYLNREDLIDPSRVGIMGFSRSCLFLKYALTHSTYRFAAASVTDGIDSGYMQYLEFLNSNPSLADEFERMNGGRPWGDGLISWLKNSPGFNIERVQTPMRIVALNSGSLMAEWQWFAILTRMGKPVEMVYLQDGNHQLIRPWDRIAAQEGNEDWFRFWLKGEEDPDPAKATQYARWRAFRDSARDHQ